jgi:hypothetical protein
MRSSLNCMHSFRSGMLWVLQFAVLVEATPLFVGEFSEFSGIVTEVRVGTPQQVLRVSVDFEGVSEDFLWRGRACPPLVTLSCFKAGDSSSFDTLRGDHIQIGGSESKTFDFKSVSLFDGSSLKFRDAAGKISLLKDVNQFSIMTVIEDDKELVVISGQTDELDNQMPIWVDGLWEFTPRAISVGSRVLEDNLSVRFDPHADALILPWSVREYLPSTFRTSGGFLYGPAGENMSIEFVMNEAVVRVPIQQLRDPKEAIGCALCKFNIRFITGSSYVVIGKQLLNSVERIHIDRDAQRLGFVPKGKRRIIPLLRSPVRFAPRFMAPDLDIHPNGFAILFSKAQDDQNGLILRSARPAVLEDNRQGFYYEFLRVKVNDNLADDVEETVLTDFPFLMAQGGLRRTIQEGLIMRLVHAGSFDPENVVRPVIAQSRSFIRLIFEKALPPHIDQLDLPSPKQELPASCTPRADRSCAICFERIVNGETVQGMQECCHWFHFECVRQWLETGHLSCPECRSSVALK